MNLYLKNPKRFFFILFCFVSRNMFFWWYYNACKYISYPIFSTNCLTLHICIKWIKFAMKLCILFYPSKRWIPLKDRYTINISKYSAKTKLTTFWHFHLCRYSYANEIRSHEDKIIVIISCCFDVFSWSFDTWCSLECCH